MGTTSEKLVYLNETKQKIKESINLTNANITDEPFRQYAVILKNRLPEILGDPSIIWNNYEHVTGSGTSITISTYKSIFEYSLNGDTTQSGTPTPDAPIPVNTVTGNQTITISDGTNSAVQYINLGKNLLNPFLLHSAGYTISSNGVDFTLNEDGTITANGTAQNGNAICILWGSWSGTTVYEKLDITKTYKVSGGTPDGNKKIFIRTRTNGVYNTYNDSTQSTITGQDELVYFALQVIDGTTVNNFVFKPMLEIGSTATSYAPYFEPIELCKIGTYQDRIYKSKGINLLDVSTAESSKYYSGTFIDNSVNWLIQQVPVKPNTNYYLSGNNKNNNSAKIWLLDENKNQLSVVGGYYETHLITTTSTTKYIGVSIANYSGESDINTIMLNEGTTQQPYEPYGSKNKWLLHKEIGKVILNGSENWLYNTSNNFFYIAFTQGDSTASLSNNFTLYSSTQLNNQNYGFAYTSSYLIIKNIDYSVVADFKTWLGTHNTIVYYILGTATTEEIKNYDLLNDLNNLELMTGSITITVSGDLPSPINITAIKN